MTDHDPGMPARVPEPAHAPLVLPPLPYDSIGIEAAFESVVDAVLVVDGDGVIVFTNRAGEHLFGYRRQDLVGQSVEGLVPAPLRAGHRDHRRHYGIAPGPRPVGLGLPLTAVRKDGTVLPVEISLAPMHTPGGSYTTALVRDVTQVRARERRFRAAFDDAPVAMALVDARAGHRPDLLMVNAALADLTGVPEHDLVGRPASVLVEPGPDGAGCPALEPDTVAASASASASASAQARVVRADGAELWARITSTLVRDDDGAPDYLVTHLVDVTDRKRAEAQLIERAARDSRIAGVLQASLMPYVPRRVGAVRAASRYRPAGHGETIGGDWSDVLSLPGGRIGMVVGDVAGHGIESAATMTRLRTAVRMLATSGMSPDGVMRRLNDVMHETDMGADIDLTTLVYAQLDVAGGTLRYCSAGHLPLLILTESDGATAVAPVPAAGGPPIGVIQGFRYSEHLVRVRPGSTLIGFTDGLIERRGDDLDLSLLQLIDALGSLPPATVRDVEALADAVVDSSPRSGVEDDIAVIVLGIDPAPMPHGSAAADPDQPDDTGVVRVLDLDAAVTTRDGRWV